MESLITSKRLGLVSVVATLMLLPGIRSTDVVTDMVTGILGSNITLKFSLNKHYNYSLDNIGLYYGNLTKVAQCMNSICSSALTINASITTVFYHMTNLSLRDSQVYHVSLYTGDVPPPTSNRVHLLVRKDNKTPTGSPPSSVSPDPSSAAEDSGASRGLPLALLLGTVVCPLLLLAAALPAVSWCLLRNKEPTDHYSQDQLPTVDERVSTMVSTCEGPPSSVIYSVLDFPQRAPPTVPDMNSDTTYATISYPPEETHV